MRCLARLGLLSGADTHSSVHKKQHAQTKHSSQPMGETYRSLCVPAPPRCLFTSRLPPVSFYRHITQIPLR
jgi:hypothetical protein